MAETTHHDHVHDSDREMPFHFFALWDVCHAIEVVTERQAMDEDMPTFQWEQTDQGFKKGRFTSPVWANNSNSSTMRNLEGKVLKHNLAVISHVDVFDFQAGGFPSQG